MKIGIIQGTTQAEKNDLLHKYTKKAVSKYGDEVINFGVGTDEKESYSYTEIAFLIALLINSKTIDFVITGCSSGQGMNLACNTLPGLLSGFVQNPQDAFLFGRINGGNVASLPLGLGFGWLGELNLQYTLEKLFEGDFGTGYPPTAAERKRGDARIVRKFNEISKKSIPEVMEVLEADFLKKILSKGDVIRFILAHSEEKELVAYLEKLL